jgi:hypothetical protein
MGERGPELILKNANKTTANFKTVLSTKLS